MKILAAIDDSLFADKVLDTAMAMAADKAAALEIVTVAPLIDEIDDMPPGMDDKLRNWAVTIVDGAVAKAKAKGLAVTGHVEQSTSPAASIAAYAKDQKADCIVIGHKGKSNLERLLVGSVAQAVVAHAPCSVFVVK